MTSNSLETPGLGEMWHIFAVSMGMPQLSPFILENLPFACIIATFLNKTLLEIKIFSNF